MLDSIYHMTLKVLLNKIIFANSLPYRFEIAMEIITYCY